MIFKEKTLPPSTLVPFLCNLRYYYNMDAQFGFSIVVLARYWWWSPCTQGLPGSVGGAAGDVERLKGGPLLHGGRVQQPQHCGGDHQDNSSEKTNLQMCFHLQGVYYMIMKNFQRHYNTNRAPFGLSYHPAWSVVSSSCTILVCFSHC